jgi:hypothetical protein
MFDALMVLAKLLLTSAHLVSLVLLVVLCCVTIALALQKYRFARCQCHALSIMFNVLVVHALLLRINAQLTSFVLYQPLFFVLTGCVPIRQITVVPTLVAHSIAHSVVLILHVLTSTMTAQLPSTVPVMHPCGALLVVACPQVKCAQINSKLFAQLTGLIALVVFVLWHQANAPLRLPVKEPRFVVVMVLADHHALV